ncbi:hypothetical protein BBP40_005836 [Aspergillus hancockii]|nr:hypothetical protein BBP40_005836 [Aspergillus hancockii]
MKMVEEHNCSIFAANNVARALELSARPELCQHLHKLVNPVLNELPRFLAKTNYANPTDPSKLAVQDVYGWDQDLFAYFKAFPEKACSLGQPHATPTRLFHGHS